MPRYNTYCRFEEKENILIGCFDTRAEGRQRLPRRGHFRQYVRGNALEAGQWGCSVAARDMNGIVWARAPAVELFYDFQSSGGRVSIPLVNIRVSVRNLPRLNI